MRVVLAFSGGLDTSFCVPYLKETYDAEVITVVVNTGGFSAEELTAIADQAKAVGASSHREVDARQAVFDRYVTTLIRGNMLRGEVYPLSVAAERTQQAIEVARIAQELKAEAVCHGSTGAGNDQVRFDVALRVLLPSITLFAPIRDKAFTRDYEIAYLRERNLSIPHQAERYSINRGLWGTTVGGAWTHDSWQSPAADTWDHVAEVQCEEAVDIEIGWDKGIPVSLNGEPLSGPDLVARLSEITKKSGVGRGIHMGETVLGIKGRVGFEAGAALVLIAAHRELEKLTLTHWQSFWKDHMSRFYSDRLHVGQAFDPVMRDIEAMIASSQATVTGDTRVRIWPRHFEVQGARSPYSLMNAQAARYGEETDLWSGEEAAAFAKISAIPSFLSASRGGSKPW